MNKSLIFFLVLVVAAAIFYFVKSDSLDKVGFGSASSSSILDAIPSNSTFFIDIVDPVSLDSALTTKKYGDLIRKYSFFDDLLEMNEALSPFLNKINPNSPQTYPLRASMHLAQRGQMKGILYYKIDNASKEFKALVKNLQETSNLNSWNYNNEQLYDVILLDQNKKIAFAYVQDILIISEVSFLVEDAVNELVDGGSLMDVAGMRDLMSSSNGQADIHLYFNYAQSDLWFSCFLNNEHLDLMKPIKNFATWSLLDIFLNDEEIYINGATAVTKSNGLNSFYQQSSAKNISNLIPNNVSFVKQVSHERIPSDFFLSNTRGEKNQVVLLESLSEDYQNQYLVYFDLEHPEAAWRILQSQPEFDFIDSVKWNGQAIVHGSCILNDQFEKEFPNISWKSSSFLIYNNVLVFAANSDVISSLKSRWIQNEVLSKDENFVELYGEEGMNAAVDVYVSTAYAQELIKSVFDKKTLSQSSTFYADLKRLSISRLSYNKDQNIFRTDGVILAKEVARATGNGLWTTKLEQNFIGKIRSFYDRATKQFLLFGQDADHQLYCYDATGKLLWRKQLDGQLVGELNEADYYRNNKSQILFNTENSIYWITKTGEDVADYPIKLSAPATAGLALFDYDRDKKYRIFVPTSNENIYGYESSGKPLPGWNPKNRIGVINRTPRHFSHKGKDYILAVNSKGKMFLWDRRGDRRISPVELSNMNTNFYLDKTVDPYKLKSVNPSGKIVAVDLKGRITSYQLSLPFVVSFSEYANLSAEPKEEIVLSNGRAVKCFSHIGKELFIYNLPEQTTSAIEIIRLNDSYQAILAYNKLSKQCYLIDGKGNLKPGFPISSEVHPQVVDLFGSGDLYLVVQNKSSELQAVRLP